MSGEESKDYSWHAYSWEALIARHPTEVDGIKNHILIDLSESTKTKVWKEPCEGQSFPQKVFSSIWFLEAEVNNGGFSLFFTNTSDGATAFAVEALETIGAPQTAEICRRAIQCAFPDGLPSEPEAIHDLAAQFSQKTSEELYALSHEFFTYPHNLSELLYAFVSRHPEEFGEVPQLG